MPVSDRVPPPPPAAKWTNMYGDFITKNASAVTQIESALRSLMYLVPGRFRESEVATETIHSGVQLLSMYHDSLLAKAVSRMPVVQRPHGSPHNRYTKFWTQKSASYRRLAFIIQILQFTELLWEMLAKRRGETTRWRVITMLETIKAVCRLLILRLTKSRLLLTPPLPEREVDPSMVEESRRRIDSLAAADASANSAAAAAAAAGGDSSAHSSDYSRPSGSVTSRSSSFSSVTSPEDSDSSWNMPRTGLKIPSLPDSADITGYLLSRVLTPDDVRSPPSLLHRVSGKGELAEILYIIRPVLYALAMQRWGKDKKSWKPWLIGFSIELGARQLARRDYQQRLPGGLRGMTALEKEEMRRRGWSLAWWAMRGAFYENVTKSWIHSATSKLQKLPIIGMIGTMMEDTQFLWDEYYFPTATL